MMQFEVLLFLLSSYSLSAQVSAPTSSCGSTGFEIELVRTIMKNEPKNIYSQQKIGLKVNVKDQFFTKLHDRCFKLPISNT